MLNRRRELSPAYVEQVSKAICKALLDFPPLLKARATVLYSSFDGEVSLHELMDTLLSRNRNVLFPQFNTSEKRYDLVSVSKDGGMKPGRYGIAEPVSGVAVCETDLSAADTAWIVPGVAFDMTGNRLGRGGGIYDRFLKHTNGLKIGVAYDWQILESIPAEAHDVTVDLLLSEHRILNFNIER